MQSRWWGTLDHVNEVSPRNRTNRMHMCVSDMCVLYIYFICLHTHIYKEIYYKELTHSIMDVDKSQVLRLARWRPRRANDVVLVQRPANSRPRKNQCFSSSPKVGKDQCSSLEAVRQEEFPLIWQGVGDQPFCSSQAFKWLDEAHPHLGGHSALLCLSLQMLNSSKINVTEIPRIMLTNYMGTPWVQSSWHIKWTITKCNLRDDRATRKRGLDFYTMELLYQPCCKREK